MDLSIIIVNYKSSHHVLKCLHSIEKCKMHINYEIIIVDNASNDGSKEEILLAYDKVIWIQSNYNSGFARANNMGIKVAKGQNILLLNSDTIILDNAIEQTVLKFNQDKQYAACGVQLKNLDGTNQFSGAKFIIGGINHFLPLPYFGDLIRKIGYYIKISQHNVFTVINDTEVDWIVGAFLLTRKSVIEKVGLLDENFFIYAEEVEWCSRIKKIGPMILYHQPKVIHIGGGTSSIFYENNSNENFNIVNGNKGRQIILSHLLRIRKQYGIVWFFIHIIVYLFEIPFFGACVLIDKIFYGKNKHYNFSEWKSYVSSIINIFRFIPSIALNKNMFYKA